MGELKPGWKRVKLGDVAINSTAATKDHEADGLNRYIIGKHIPEDGSRITSWNPVGDAEFGSRIRTIVRAGDVICTTRGPKLKVAAIDFDCLSAHTNFILRPKDSVTLLPTILEAIVRSDGFQDHLRKHFRGSTNLFVNWSDAAQYEFALPPPEEQRKMCRILTSIEISREAMSCICNELGNVLDALTQWYATAGLRKVDASGIVVRADLPADWQLESIRNLCTGNGGGLTLGPFGSALKVDDYGHLTEGTPVLFVADVGRFGLHHHSQKFISAEKHAALIEHEAIEGDVLVTEMGWPPGEACIVPAGWPPSIIKADIIRIRVNRTLVAPEYVELALNSHWGQQQVVRISPGTTRPRMTLRDFERLLIAVPSRKGQERAVRQVADLRTRQQQAAARLKELDAVRAAALASTLEKS